MSSLAPRYGREDGLNGFFEAEVGRKFREAAFKSHGLQPPAAGNLPRTITLLSAVQGEEVHPPLPHACIPWIEHSCTPHIAFIRSTCCTAS